MTVYLPKLKSRVWAETVLEFRIALGKARSCNWLSWLQDLSFKGLSQTHSRELYQNSDAPSSLLLINAWTPFREKTFLLPATLSHQLDELDVVGGRSPGLCLVSTEPFLPYGACSVPPAPPSLSPSRAALKPYYFYEGQMRANCFPCPEHLTLPVGDTGDMGGGGGVQEQPSPRAPGCYISCSHDDCHCVAQ